MLSEKQLVIRSQYNIARSDLNAKLIPNLMNKKEYVVHYSNLRFYLEHGMKLTKVHCAIRFEQSAWMARYILKNQGLRMNAQNEFETEFFKLMNNAVFGKTCENQKKRTDIKLLNDAQKFHKLAHKPNFMDCRIFSRDICGVELQKTRLWINKPFYVGFTVLELAKLHMYQYVSFRFFLNF